jgi:hypothetical protein
MPVESNINLYKQPIRCFRIEDITIYSSLKKTEIERIILSLLSQNCGMNVIGYNKDTDEYWCKNVKNANVIITYKNTRQHQQQNKHIIIFVLIMCSLNK